MRPASIDWFDRLYLGSTALSALNVAFTYPKMMDELAKETGASDGGAFIFWVTMALTFGVSILLWYMAARRASNFARWILVTLTVIGLIALPFSIGQDGSNGMEIAATLVTTAISAASLWFLFTPQARAWFASGGTKGPVDSRVFD